MLVVVLLKNHFPEIEQSKYRTTAIKLTRLFWQAQVIGNEWMRNDLWKAITGDTARVIAHISTQTIKNE